jgi:hypothetical protein
MSGVEILSTSEVVAETTFSSTAVWVTIGITMLIAIIVGIWLTHATQYTASFFICILLGMLMSLLTGACAVVATSTPVAYETHYKVTINDSVVMNEFNDKYEILDQEDKIYTIRERVVG